MVLNFKGIQLSFLLFLFSSKLVCPCTITYQSYDQSPGTIWVTFSPLLTPILGFRVMSRPPCWCPDLFLREFNPIIVQTFSFVFIENMAVEHVSEIQEYKSTGVDE